MTGDMISQAPDCALVDDAMFELPSQKDSKKLVISKAYAEEKFEKSKLNKLRVAG